MTLLAVVVQMVFLALVAQAALDRYGMPTTLSHAHWPTLALIATTLASVVLIGQTLVKWLIGLVIACMLSTSFLLGVAYVFSGEGVRSVLSEALTHTLKRVV